MYENIIDFINEKSQGKDRFLVCIDGKSGSGKTVCGEYLAEKLGADLVHIDYFYIPIAQRPENWDKIPRGNMDLARLENTVLKPFTEGKEVTYYRFQPRGQMRAEDISLTGKKILILEGSYSMHPSLQKYYDAMIFLTCDVETQTDRLKKREGERFAFFTQWVGRELEYHKAFDISAAADMIVDTSRLF